MDDKLMKIHRVAVELGGWGQRLFHAVAFAGAKPTMSS